MTITQSILQKALQTLGKAVASNPTIPATECYQFNIKANELTIAATNMKFHISTIIEVEAQDICVLINAALLNELIRSLPEQPIKFEFANNQVIIRYNESGKTTLPTESGDNFPKPETPKVKQTLLIDSNILISGFNRTEWAIAKDRPDRPMLECVNIGLSPGNINFTASDGFQLGTYNYAAEHSVKANLLIPDYCLSAFDLPTDSQIAMIIGDKSLSLQYDSTTIIATLFDGKFPDISAVIPIDQPYLAIVNKNELLPIINRVKTFANKTTKQLRLSFSDGLLNIRAENFDYGHEAEEQIAIDYKGDSIEIGVASDKFLAGIKNMGETIYMSLSAPNRAIVMRDVEANGKDNLTLVMPNVLK